MSQATLRPGRGHGRASKAPYLAKIAKDAVLAKKRAQCAHYAFATRRVYEGQDFDADANIEYQIRDTGRESRIVFSTFNAIAIIAALGCLLNTGKLPDVLPQDIVNEALSSYVDSKKVS